MKFHRLHAFLYCRLLIGSVAAQFQGFAPFGNDELSYTIRVL